MGPPATTRCAPSSTLTSPSRRGLGAGARREGGPLGSDWWRPTPDADTPKPKSPEDRRPGVTPSPEDDDAVPYEKVVRGSFLVAAYRRPGFGVDVSLTGENAIAGGLLKGVFSSRYLFGASMGARPAT